MVELPPDTARSASLNECFFPSIDALRAVAALSVLLFHVIGYNQWTGFYHYPGYLLRQGWLGVDLFFVISGLVISISLFSLYDSGGSYRSTFLIKRAFRICPLHYITCIVFIFVVTPSLVSQEGFVWDVIRYAIFVHHFDPQKVGLINPPNWSLAVEVQFYLFFAMAIPVLRNANVLVVLISSVIIAAAWRLGCYWGLRDSAGRMYAPFLFTTQLPGMLDCFAMGFVLARILTDADFKKVRDWSSKNVSVLLLMSVLAYGAAHYLYSRVPITYDDWRLDQRWYLLTGHHALTAAAFTFLTLGCCFLSAPGWLKISAPVRYLGVISYGVYLWHVIVILTLKRFPDLSASARLSLTLVLTFVLASASWHFIEKPLSRWVKANATHTIG